MRACEYVITDAARRVIAVVRDIPRGPDGRYWPPREMPPWAKDLREPVVLAPDGLPGLMLGGPPKVRGLRPETWILIEGGVLIGMTGRTTNSRASRHVGSPGSAGPPVSRARAPGLPDGRGLHTPCLRRGRSATARWSRSVRISTGIGTASLWHWRRRSCAAPAMQRGATVLEADMRALAPQPARGPGGRRRRGSRRPSSRWITRRGAGELHGLR
jgi:hypothetical protein